MACRSRQWRWGSGADDSRDSVSVAPDQSGQDLGTADPVRRVGIGALEGPDMQVKLRGDSNAKFENNAGSTVRAAPRRD